MSARGWQWQTDNTKPSREVCLAKSLPRWHEEMLECFERIGLAASIEAGLLR